MTAENAMCQSCGQAPATSRVTQVIDGRAEELRVCARCGEAFALLDRDDALRCSKCGSKFAEGTPAELLRSLESKAEGLDEAAWEEFLRSAACRICGERLALPRIPWSLISDPWSALSHRLLTRRRTHPPKEDPQS